MNPVEIAVVLALNHRPGGGVCYRFAPERLVVAEEEVVWDAGEEVMSILAAGNISQEVLREACPIAATILTHPM